VPEEEETLAKTQRSPRGESDLKTLSRNNSGR
jgi:hypothetical protein